MLARATDLRAQFIPAHRYGSEGGLISVLLAFAAELGPQFILGALEHCLLRLRQVLAATVDVKIQHRHR